MNQSIPLCSPERQDRQENDPTEHTKALRMIWIQYNNKTRTRLSKITKIESATIYKKSLGHHCYKVFMNGEGYCIFFYTVPELHSTLDSTQPHHTYQPTILRYGPGTISQYTSLLLYCTWPGTRYSPPLPGTPGI